MVVKPGSFTPLVEVHKAVVPDENPAMNLRQQPGLNPVPKRESSNEASEASASRSSDTSRRGGSDTSRSHLGSLSSRHLQRPLQRALEVPPCFSYWCEEGVQLSSEDSNKKMHDQVVSTFIMSMLRGVQVHVLLDDGSLLAVEASFDVRITRLTLRVREVERNIPLENIERVAGPEDAQAAWNTNAVHLTDCCMTLVFTDTHYLTFSFETPKLCSYFEFCLSAVLLSYRLRASKGNALGSDASGITPIHPTKFSPREGTGEGSLGESFF